MLTSSSIDEDEEGETAGCRDRIHQSKIYTVPKTAAYLETVDSEVYAAGTSICCRASQRA